MDKKYFILLIVCIFLVVDFTSADIVSSCRTISNSGYYELNQSITSTGTCMTIAASNVDFNCNGSTISYNSAGGATAYGINAIYLLVPLDNITIRNCDIKDTTAAGTPSGGIQFTRVTDSYIFNNTIQTNGTTLNHGITLTTGCKRNRIENNTVNTLGSGITNVGIYLNTEASNNNITGNNVVGIGTLTSYAVYLAVDANDNLVGNNNLSTISTVAAANADPHVVVVSSSKRNYIFNNYIYGQGDRRGYAVYITTNAESTSIENNSILMNLTPTGTTGYGIYLLRTSITNVKNNNISMFGTGTLHGVYMTNAPYTNASKNVVNINIPAGSTFSGFTASANSPYSEIKENNITINGVGTFNGIAITSSGSSNIENNILNLAGTATTINGIISTDSPLSYFQNNNISISGTTTLNGIYATTSYSGTILKNNISISGTTTLNGILATSSRSALVENNSIYISGSASATNAPVVGIYFSSSSVGDIKNNSINVTGAAGVQGVYLYYNSLGNLVEENIISTYGTGSTNPGIYLTTGSNENTIQKNIITTGGLGTTNYGVYILTSSNNVVYLNNISTSGTTTNYGVYLLTQAGNNTVENNIISAYGTTTNYGIYINGANYNKLIGNNITANGSTQVAGTTTSNHGIAVGASSYFSEVYNNTIYNGGGRYNYGIHSLTNSRWGVFRGNDVHTGGTGNLNVGAYISESHYNTFENNIFSTSGSTTNHGVYLHSSARENTIENNNISTSGGTDSHAFGFLYVAAGGYPERNIIKNNRLLSIAGRDLNFETASTNGTILIDQTIGNYSFTGTAGTLTIRNESAGEISFSNVLSGSGTTFSDKIFVWPNLAAIDESVSALNKSAVITFYNVSTTSTELQIYRNGEVCPESICTNITSLQAGNVTFNVTHGGNYSILQTSALPIINLDYPENNFNSSSQDITFNFTATDDSIGNLNCSIYINSILNQTNNSVFNGTITSFVIENLEENIYSWQIECYDFAGNRNVSEIRNFSIIISQPSYTFNSPGNNSYLNGASSVLLNYSVFDSDLRNMTVYLYGNDILLNTSENIENGTNILYNWTGLSLGQHNWSIKTSNGIKNSTIDYNYFNLINLTVNCEAGGPYLENSIVLINGQISEVSGLVSLNNQSINLLVYNSTGSLVDSSNTTTSSNGIFNSIFTDLNVDNYTAYAVVNYQDINVNDSVLFLISYGYESGYQAGFIAGNESGYILGFGEGNSSGFITGFNLGNISGFYFGNLTGYESGFIIGNESGFIEGYALGNTTGFILGNESGFVLGNATGFIIGNTTGFILGNQTGFIEGNMTGFETGFDLGNATGFVLGNLTGYLIGYDSGFYFGNLTGYESGYQAGNNGPALLVLDKIANFYNLTNDTIVYNITLKLTNRGRGNATNVNISDADFGPIIDIGDINSSEVITRSYLINFTRNSTTYFNSTAIAQVSGIDTYSSNLISTNSNSINLSAPATVAGQQLTLVKNVYYNFENSTSVNYSISIEVVNSGGEDLIGIVISDQDLDLTTTQSLNRSQSYNYFDSIIIEKAASNLEYDFYKTTATVNAVQYDSNIIKIIIPGYGGPADAIVYAPSSVLTSTSFVTNITVENQNPDIGQDFVIDYWITNVDETINYTSGQQTIYVGASGTSEVTSTLTSPATPGNYRFRALVTWVGGTATAYDSFEVTSSNQTGGSGEGVPGGSSSPSRSDTGGAVISSAKKITGDSVLDIPGKLQIVEYPENIIIISGENITKNITVMNTGNETLHNVKVIISGLPLEFYSISPNEVDIVAGNIQTYEIVFTPIGESKSYFFTVLVSSDELNEEETAMLQVKSINQGISFMNTSSLITYTLLFVVILIIGLLIKIKSRKVAKIMLAVFILLILTGFVIYFSLYNLLLETVIELSSIGLSNIIIISLSLILVFVLGLLVKSKLKSEYKPKRSKHPRNSVLGLIKKDVYTDSGHYVGKVIEVIVHKNKIDSLMIKLNKKKKARGVIIKYGDVISIGQIIIINHKVLENL